jgi:hypothetical protein
LKQKRLRNAITIVELADNCGKAALWKQGGCEIRKMLKDVDWSLPDDELYLDTIIWWRDKQEYMVSKVRKKRN